MTTPNTSDNQQYASTSEQMISGDSKSFTAPIFMDTNDNVLNQNVYNNFDESSAASPPNKIATNPIKMDILSFANANNYAQYSRQPQQQQTTDLMSFGLQGWPNQYVKQDLKSDRDGEQYMNEENHGQQRAALLQNYMGQQVYSQEQLMDQFGQGQKINSREEIRSARDVQDVTESPMHSSVQDYDFLNFTNLNKESANRKSNRQNQTLQNSNKSNKSNQYLKSSRSASSIQEMSDAKQDKKHSVQNDLSNQINVSLLGESMNQSKSIMNKSTMSVTKSGIPKPQRGAQKTEKPGDGIAKPNHYSMTMDNRKRQSIGSHISDSFIKPKNSMDASNTQLNNSSKNIQSQLPSPERNVLFGLNHQRKSQNLKEKIQEMRKIQDVLSKSSNQSTANNQVLSQQLQSMTTNSMQATQRAQGDKLLPAHFYNFVQSPANSNDPEQQQMNAKMDSTNPLLNDYQSRHAPFSRTKSVSSNNNAPLSSDAQSILPQEYSTKVDSKPPRTELDLDRARANAERAASNLKGGVDMPSLQDLNTRIKNSDLNNSNYVRQDEYDEHGRKRSETVQQVTKPIASPSSLLESERQEREEYDKLMKEVRLFKQQYQIESERNRQIFKQYEDDGQKAEGHDEDDLESTERQKTSQRTETVSDSPKQREVEKLVERASSEEDDYYDEEDESSNSENETTIDQIDKSLPTIEKFYSESTKNKGQRNTPPATMTFSHNSGQQSTQDLQVFNTEGHTAALQQLSNSVANGSAAFSHGRNVPLEQDKSMTVIQEEDGHLEESSMRKLQKSQMTTGSSRKSVRRRKKKKEGSMEEKRLKKSKRAKASICEMQNRNDEQVIIDRKKNASIDQQQINQQYSQNAKIHAATPCFNSQSVKSSDQQSLADVGVFNKGGSSHKGSFREDMAYQSMPRSNPTERSQEQREQKDRIQESKVRAEEVDVSVDVESQNITIENWSKGAKKLHDATNYRSRSRMKDLSDDQLVVQEDSFDQQSNLHRKPEHHGHSRNAPRPPVQPLNMQALQDAPAPESVHTNSSKQVIDLAGQHKASNDLSYYHTQAQSYTNTQQLSYVNTNQTIVGAAEKGESGTKGGGVVGETDEGVVGRNQYQLSSDEKYHNTFQSKQDLPYQTEAIGQDSDRPPSELKQIIQNYTSRHSEQYAEDAAKGATTTACPEPASMTDINTRKEQVIQSEKCAMRKASMSPTHSDKRGPFGSRQSRFSYVNTESQIEKTMIQGKDGVQVEIVGGAMLQPSNTSLAFQMSDQLITPLDDPDLSMKIGQPIVMEGEVFDGDDRKDIEHQHKVKTSFLQRMIAKHHEKLEKQNMQTARFEDVKGGGPNQSRMFDLDDGESLQDSKVEIREKAASIVEQSRLEIMDIKRQYDDNTGGKKAPSTKGTTSCDGKEKEQVALKIALETSGSVQDHESAPVYVNRTYYQQQQLIGKKAETMVTKNISDDVEGFIDVKLMYDNVGGLKQDTLLSSKAGSSYQSSVINKIQGANLNKDSFEYDFNHQNSVSQIGSQNMLPPRNFFTNQDHILSEIEMQASHFGAGASQNNIIQNGISPGVLTNVSQTVKSPSVSAKRESFILQKGQCTPSQFLRAHSQVFVPPTSADEADDEQQDINASKFYKLLGQFEDMNQNEVDSEVDQMPSNSVNRTTFKSVPMMEQWILLSHKMTSLIQEKNKEIHKLRQTSKKLIDDNRVTLQKEKQKSKDLQDEHQRQIEKYKLKMEKMKQAHEKSLQLYRDRVKSVEIEQVVKQEEEYAQLIETKEREIFRLKQEVELYKARVEERDTLIIEAKSKALVQVEEVHRQTDREKQEYLQQMDGERRRLVERQVNQIKEILTQEFEFRRTQLESQFKKSQEQAQKQLQIEKDEFIQKKEEEYEATLTKDKCQMINEKMKQQAEMTQELHTDISKQLQQKYKSQLKSKVSEQKSALAQQYDKQIRQMKIEYEKELALERKKVAQTDLKNAQQSDSIIQFKKEIAALKKEMTKMKEQQSYY